MGAVAGTTPGVVAVIAAVNHRVTVINPLNAALSMVSGTGGLFD